MAKIYTTTDYFRDSFWIIDKFYDLAVKSRKFTDSFVRKVINYDFETYVFRIIENLPYGLALLFLGFFLTITLFRITETSNGIIVSSIYTNSMAPNIKPGSLVITFPEGNYQVGDVITYKEKSARSNEYTGRILTHRISEIKLDDSSYKKFIAKGDNNKNPDSNYIVGNDIFGKVRFVFPYFGYIDFLSRTIPGFIVLIGLPSILLIIEAKRYMFSE